MRHFRRVSQPVDCLPVFSLHRPKVQPGEQPVLGQVLGRPPVLFRFTTAIYAAIGARCEEVDTSAGSVDHIGRGNLFPPLAARSPSGPQVLCPTT